MIRFGSAYLLNLPAAIEREGLGCVTVAEALGLVTVGRDAVKPWEQQLGKVGVTVTKGERRTARLLGVMGEDDEEEDEDEEEEEEEEGGKGKEGRGDEGDGGEEEREGGEVAEGEADGPPGAAKGSSSQVHGNEGFSQPTQEMKKQKKKKKARLNLKKAALSFYSYVSGRHGMVMEGDVMTEAEHYTALCA